MRPSSLCFVLSALLATACSATPRDWAGSQSSAVVVGTPTFFTIAASSQGGFDVTSVNMAVVTHVASIDYSGSGLDEATIASLQALPSAELLLQGTTSGSTLVVSTAYEGMPGMTYSPSATFYQTSNATAVALNQSAPTQSVCVDVTAAAAPHVQLSWLSAQVMAGALVAGEVAQGSNVLAATQVFIPLPYAASPCVISSHICSQSAPWDTYTRGADLCVEFAGCESLGICPDFIPECWAGYTRTSWRGGQGACMQYACDPSFLQGS
jgi:hypothetical protein